MQNASLALSQHTHICIYCKYMHIYRITTQPGTSTYVYVHIYFLTTHHKDQLSPHHPNPYHPPSPPTFTTHPNHLTILPHLHRLQLTADLLKLPVHCFILCHELSSLLLKLHLLTHLFSVLELEREGGGESEAVWSAGTRFKSQRIWNVCCISQRHDNPIFSDSTSCCQHPAH